MITRLFKGAMLSFFTAAAAFAAEIVVDDTDDVLAGTGAPVTANVKLSRSESRAAAQGRLQLRETTSNRTDSSVLATPAQLFPTDVDGPERICWLMPPGAKGKRTFKLETTRYVPQPKLSAAKDATTDQFEITEAGKPVLCYNYATVEPGDIVEQLKPHKRIYARARGDYIHPLFGLDGETLTKDWSADHPHHRGIYWAWPEVDWRTNRGDLHALQNVFARPTGKCKTSSGPVFAQIEAENLWKWEDTNAVVRERAVIRAYRATGDARVIDLEFEFTALDDPVLLARRQTLHYGGLNLRFAKVTDQVIATNTSPAQATPRVAWAEVSGRFDGATNASGLVILQSCANPDYPGDWVQYPQLNWLQPTFPAGGTRYELKKGQPLVLRFRLWLHRGGKSPEEKCTAQWRAYQLPSAPKYFPVSAGLKRPSSS